MRGPDPVNAHVKGVSPLGVMDMVGNVWQWTEEFADEHTRAAIRRGSSYYQPQGSIWYFPKLIGERTWKAVADVAEYGSLGYGGFRCVRDAR
jgi:iron(II)-dependent oxidoreductase